MNAQLEQALEAVPVVPLLNAGSAPEALALAEALASGGLRVIEVVMRNPRALECLGALAAGTQDLIVGAGTVLNRAQAVAALAAGAQFLVSPGLDEGVVETGLGQGVPVFPGVSSATELQRAWNLGLRSLKFFPAALSGGPAMLRALADVFPDVRFFATGGISPSNLADYLSLRAVLAVGGSWMVPADAVARGDYAAIAALARDAVIHATSARAGNSGTTNHARTPG